MCESVAAGGGVHHERHGTSDERVSFGHSGALPRHYTCERTRTDELREVVRRGEHTLPWPRRCAPASRAATVVPTLDRGLHFHTFVVLRAHRFSETTSVAIVHVQLREKRKKIICV